MNTNTSESHTSETKHPSPAPRARRTSTITGGLALILSLMALVIAAYLWYGLGEKQRLFGSNVVGNVDELTASVNAVKTANSDLAQQLAVLREMQAALKDSMDRINANLAGGRGDFFLAEAEQLLIIASHRLQLDQDVRLALAALRAADREIRQLPNPNLLQVRKQIAEDIGRLEAVNQVDFEGIAIKLGNLASRIDAWPLAVETSFKLPEGAPDKVTQEGSAWSRFWRDLWQDLRNLVRIRHNAEKRRPLMPADQQYFLRENLRLMLYGAQLALLRRDEGTYQQNLRSAQSWLKEYFDLGSPSVASAVGEIDGLLKNRLTIELPDISASLRALQRVAKQQP